MRCTMYMDNEEQQPIALANIKFPCQTISAYSYIAYTCDVVLSTCIKTENEPPASLLPLSKRVSFPTSAILMKM